MVRISDILRKKPEPEPEPSKEPKKEEIKAPLQDNSGSEEAKEIKANPVEAQAPQMQIAQAMKELEPDMSRSQNLYGRGIVLIEKLLNDIQNAKDIDILPVRAFVDEVVNSFILGDKTLLIIFHEDLIKDDYLPYHMLNVMLMSTAMGLKFGYNKSRLDDLGLAAFLHDVGMTKLRGIVNSPRFLSDAEYGKVKEHTLYSEQMLSQVKDMPASVLEAVRQQHEHSDGKGYPQGLRGQEICEFARIISTVDMYEALTHRRAYRQQLAPYEAIKEMLTTSNALLDHRIFKMLINIVGVYPVGSYAELNTGEVAKVMAPNDDFPLRPVVNIIFDANRNTLAQSRIINLARQFNVNIKRPLSGEEVSRLARGAG